MVPETLGHLLVNKVLPQRGAINPTPEDDWSNFVGPRFHGIETYLPKLDKLGVSGEQGQPIQEQKELLGHSP